MKSETFFADVKHRASRPCLATDPLGQARQFLESSGLTAEGQMVRKAVVALGSKEGEFGDSDVHRLGTVALGLVSALSDARTARRYSDAEWAAAARAGE